MKFLYQGSVSISLNAIVSIFTISFDNCLSVSNLVLHLNLILAQVGRYLTSNWLEIFDILTNSEKVSNSNLIRFFLVKLETFFECKRADKFNLFL